MIDYSILPSSEGVPLNEVTVPIEGVRFTFIENMDERVLYNDLDKRLTGLETSTEMDKEELASIKDASKGFKVVWDEKEEVFLRLDWLRRLYDVKEATRSVETKESANRLRTVLASVQTCPMKNELLVELDRLEKTLPSEQTGPLQISAEQELMERAIEEAGDVFTNLGKSGREFVIADVFKQFGKKATVENVREHTITLEQRVENLADVKEHGKLRVILEDLPIHSYAALSVDRRERITKSLLQTNKWEGLASLERRIVQLDRALTNEELQQEEAENLIRTLDGKAALTLDVNSVDKGRIELS